MLDIVLLSVWIAVELLTLTSVQQEWAKRRDDRERVRRMQTALDPAVWARAARMEIQRDQD